MSDNQVSDGAARSVAGAGSQGALVKLAVSTTVIVFDVSGWIGRYIKITPRGNGIYYNFSSSSVVGGLDPTVNNVLALGAPDAGLPNKMSKPLTPNAVPDSTPNDVPVHEVVPGFISTVAGSQGGAQVCFLLVRTWDASATCDVRVRAA